FNFFATDDETVPKTIVLGSTDPRSECSNFFCCISTRDNFVPRLPLTRKLRARFCLQGPKCPFRSTPCMMKQLA
ncbi:hypothetical protein MUK42_35045, partial [Musa troglodytarum]